MRKIRSLTLAGLIMLSIVHHRSAFLASGIFLIVTGWKLVRAGAKDADLPAAADVQVAG